MNGQRIGYVRVSSFDQNPERQVMVQGAQPHHPGHEPRVRGCFARAY